MLAAREVRDILAHIGRDWAWVFDPDSRFARFAFLLGVRSLRIEGVRVLHSAQDPTLRKDEWLEIKLGEFFNEGRDDIRMKIKQLDPQWKKGLMVDGIEIRPKDNLLMNFPFIFSKDIIYCRKAFSQNMEISYLPLRKGNIE
ncbi:hypothetical protein PVL29_004812 [Vitis rotundifolia]|uniref:Uncharacterized protein n=1 Tax=Vitis rotundifolia TaxID=103349 RepID=A0AA39AB29_VITRO|nr:hypothetical protein PVL29_004812 [Vitis rotundifolia]